MRPPGGVFAGGVFAGGELRDRRRWFRATGEYRAPRKGERYLSGAIVAAYVAPSDFGDGNPYLIAEEVSTPPMHVTVGAFRYRLEGPA